MCGAKHENYKLGSIVAALLCASTIDGQGLDGGGQRVAGMGICLDGEDSKAFANKYFLFFSL